MTNGLEQISISSLKCKKYRGDDNGILNNALIFEKLGFSYVGWENMANKIQIYTDFYLLLFYL